MPEVCEVALSAQILDETITGLILEKFTFLKGRYLNINPFGYTDLIKLLPLKVKSVNSRGKFLYFDLSKIYIWNTFGMTGEWSLIKPKSINAQLDFTNGISIYYTDYRNFGTFRFDKSKQNLEKKLSELGPDFLKEDVNIDKVSNYDIPIVKLLMDQKKLGSGIGNYLSAEILYQAKISPFRLGSSLSKKEIKNLKYAIDYQTKCCYESNHSQYLVPLKLDINKLDLYDYHPSIKNVCINNGFQIYRKKTDSYGNPVVGDSIIKDRTTYWVPNVQK